VCAATGLVVFFVVGLTGLLDSPVYQAPVGIVVDCHAGDYYVYQQVGSQVSGPGFSFSHTGLSTLAPDQVRVTSTNGTQLSTWATDSSETITEGSGIYASTVGFHVAAAGKYKVQIAAVTPSSVIVAPSIGSQFVHATQWLVVVGIGGLLTIVGIMLLIVAIVRRTHQKGPPPNLGPPMQWIPPPAG
jgi:hypothetical protein